MGRSSNRLDRDGDALENATVLLVDRKNTAQNDQAFAIQRIAKFLQARRIRGSGHRIGIYTFGAEGSLHVVQEVTDDAGLLSRAAGSLKARDPNSSSYEPAGFAMDTKHVLEAIARHLASVPGRKSLVWVSSSFPLVPEPGKFSDTDVNAPVEEAAGALNDANVALYAVDARGLDRAPVRDDGHIEC